MAKLSDRMDMMQNALDQLIKLQTDANTPAPPLSKEEQISKIIKNSGRNEKNARIRKASSAFNSVSSWFNPKNYRAFSAESSTDKAYLEKLAQEHYSKGDDITGDAISRMKPEREFSFMKTLMTATAVAGIAYGVSVFTGYEGNFIDFIKAGYEDFAKPLWDNLTDNAFTNSLSEGFNMVGKGFTETIADPLIAAMGGGDGAQMAFYGGGAFLATAIGGTMGVSGLAIGGIIASALVATGMNSQFSITRTPGQGAMTMIDKFKDGAYKDSLNPSNWFATPS